MRSPPTSPTIDSAPVGVNGAAGLLVWSGYSEVTNSLALRGLKPEILFRNVFAAFLCKSRKCNPGRSASQNFRLRVYYNRKYLYCQAVVHTVVGLLEFS